MITTFVPTHGVIGTSVTITGTGLIGISWLKFNGTPVGSWARGGTTTITTVVPAGATTGPISLSTPGGTTTSAALFTVTSAGSYTITATAEDDGSIEPNGVVKVNACSSQQFTATPSRGYTVNQWTLDNEVVATGTTSYTVSNVQANHKLSVTFVGASAQSHSRFDFNADGKDDLLWQNSQTGQLVVWDMNGMAVSPSSEGNVFATVNPTWKIKGVADINNDGHPDLLWWNSYTGQIIFWELTGAPGTTQIYGSPVAYTVSNTQWQPVSMADFDGDGHPDILWENMSTGQLIVWYMNGTTQMSATGVFATIPSDCRVAGTGDFNQDGHPDIVLESVKSGSIAIWYMGGSTGTSILSKSGAFMTIPNLSWQIASTGDMDGDGHPDLTWHNTSTGQTIVWLMGGANGTTQLHAGAPLAVSPKTTWSIVGVR
jgi:hypothetical protein